MLLFFDEDKENLKSPVVVTTVFHNVHCLHTMKHCRIKKSIYVLALDSNSNTYEKVRRSVTISVRSSLLELDLCQLSPNCIIAVCTEGKFTGCAFIVVICFVSKRQFILTKA